MTRPRIEFVQNQALPRVTEPLATSRPGAEARVLSQDA